mgnify:CR=1 FL=1
MITLRAVRHAPTYIRKGGKVKVDTRVKLLLLPIGLGLLLSIVGCQSASPAAKKMAERSGIPVEKQQKIQVLLENGDKNDGLTDAEWEELKRYAADSDPAVRKETIIAIGGISYKKTTQSDKVVAFLESFANDPDPSVRKAAETFLPMYKRDNSEVNK